MEAIPAPVLRPVETGGAGCCALLADGAREAGFVSERFGGRGEGRDLLECFARVDECCDEGFEHIVPGFCGGALECVREVAGADGKFRYWRGWEGDEVGLWLGLMWERDEC